MRAIQMPLLLLSVTVACAPLAAEPTAERLTVCDFDTVTVPWRSKFSRHSVVDVVRDGQPTRALQVECDLSAAPGYDWVRSVSEPGLDVRPFSYLTLRLKAGGAPMVLVPVLIQRSTRPEASSHGEITATANRHTIVPTGPEWQHVSVPLSGFEGLARIAAEVTMVNFSLTRGDLPAGPAVLFIDDVAFSREPLGTVVELQEEPVRYPPADIAIGDDAGFFAALDLDRPELAAVRAAAAVEDWGAAKAAWARHLETRREPLWTWSHRDRDAIKAYLETHAEGLAWAVPHAERVLAREFDFLGVKKTLERDIAWLQGPVEWTHVLSRFHYWRSLGYAYWHTGDSRYAEDFVHMLRHWVASNPVPRILTNSRGRHGTVWRTLEAGIRGDLWFDAMELFMHAPEFDAEAKTLLTRSLVEHARHLHRYQVAFRPGNWQVVECTGLAAIGIMLPEFKEAAGWRERAFAYLQRHMQDDVYPDGAHSELTPGYHGWVMERFMKAALLARANGYDIPGLMDRHERMFEFLLAIAKPDATFPALGDAGSGGSVRGNLGLGALLYGRADMRYLGVEQAPWSWIWLFGPEVFQRYAALPKAPPSFASILLPNAKYGMQRTGWERDSLYLLFDCAPWGGGHSHQDRLQVMVHAGRDLLLDPGIYSYDQPLSGSYFRKSRAHNVLLIDEQEQIAADPRVLAWSTAPGFDLAVGEIADPKSGLRHRRTVLFVKPDYWLVVDHVLGTGEHDLTRLWNLPPTEIAWEGNRVETRFDAGTNILLQGLDEARVEARQGWLPTGGATAREMPVAAYTLRRSLPAALATLILPWRADADRPTVEVLTGADRLVVGVILRFPDGQEDRVAIGPEIGPLQAGTLTATARAACRRTGPRATAAFAE